MKKYNKAGIKFKRFRILIYVFLIIIIAAIGCFLIYLSQKNIITLENTSDEALFVSQDEAQNSTPIVVNNILMGAVYNNKWVSSNMYYTQNSNKTDVEVDVYRKSGKTGSFYLTDFTMSDSKNIYTSTTRMQNLDEYFAVAKNSSNLYISMDKISNITDVNISKIKKALGMYNVLNNTVKVTSAYDVKISNDVSGKIFCVTSKNESILGLYSAVIFVDNTGNSKIIKYSYLNDKNRADKWPVYDVIFNADFNVDNKAEIVLQEVTEFYVTYSILEYRNGNFVQVLQQTIKI